MFRLGIPGKIVSAQLARPHGLLAGRTLRRLESNNAGLVRRAIALAELRPGETAADVGFGNTTGLQLMLDEVGPSGHVFGVDPSRAALRRARRQMSTEIKAGRVIISSGTFERLPLADHSLDAVITLNTVYFCPDLQPVRDELARVTRPGARVVVGIADPQRMRDAGMPLHDFTLRAPEELSLALQTPGRLDFVGTTPIPKQPMGFRYLSFLAQELA